MCVNVLELAFNQYLIMSTQAEARDRTDSETGKAPTFTQLVVQQTSANQGHSKRVTPTVSHAEVISPRQLVLLQ